MLTHVNPHFSATPHTHARAYNMYERECLPLEFTRAEAVEMAVRMGIPPSSVDTAIARMVARDRLRKTLKGRYAFNKAVRNGDCSK